MSVVALDAEDVEVLVAALTDAIDYRLDGGGDGCGDCTHDELCGDHVNDQRLADQYQAVLDKIRT